MGYFVVGALVAIIGGQPFAIGALQSLLQVVLLLGVLYLGLGLLRRGARFLQSATALFGTGLILSLVALLPIGLLPTDPASQAAPLTALLLLVVFVWSVLVAGHIVRHTLDLTLEQGVAIAILYELSSLVLLNALLPSS